MKATLEGNLWDIPIYPQEIRYVTAHNVKGVKVYYRYELEDRGKAPTGERIKVTKTQHGAV